VDGAIVVDGLVKRFRQLTALDRVSFEVGPGTVFGLLGPNAAGKTTAIRVLTTLLRPDAGHASVVGHDVVREATAVRHLIGLAGQSATVDVTLTGRENLRLIGRLAQMPRSVFVPRADEPLERFGLTDAASRPVRSYSGGMRRRLDVAAALVARSPVVFLDEPTTGLDLQSRNGLWQMIRELVDGGDLRSGLLERFRSLPMARFAVLAGRMIADLARNVFVLALMVAVGVAVGFRIHNGIGPFLGGLVLVLLFGYAMAWVFAVVGLVVGDPESALAASFPVMAPLVFASSAFIPVATMPGWLQAFAAHQPVSLTASAVRATVLGGPTAIYVWQSLAWAAGIVAVFAPLGPWRYHRSS
jgi:ABC transporter DrrB family efflux protein